MLMFSCFCLDFIDISQALYNGLTTSKQYFSFNDFKSVHYQMGSKHVKESPPLHVVCS